LGEVELFGGAREMAVLAADPERAEGSCVKSGTGKSPAIEVACVPAVDANGSGFVAKLVDLINRVYAEAEKGLWRDGAARTDARESRLSFAPASWPWARLNGHLVGAVRIQRLDSDVGEFGMLVASPEYRGIGIGRGLVAFAEDWARQQGLSRMQLELLVPQAWIHPVKEFLHGWYTRIGYRKVRTGRLSDAYPELQPQLATPCDFAIYHKQL
jgi:GNAT superfamily N-acetyltransferase